MNYSDLLNGDEFHCLGEPGTYVVIARRTPYKEVEGKPAIYSHWCTPAGRCILAGTRHPPPNLQVVKLNYVPNYEI